MAKRKDEFKESDWLIELERASKKQPARDGFLLSREIAAALGWSAHRVAARLREASVQGRLEVRRILVENIDGAARPCPVYRIRAK